MFGHDSNLKWSERQDFHLRPPGPRPGALKTELRSDKMADSNPDSESGLNPPADNPDASGLIELRVQKMVGGAGNAPVVTSGVIFFDTGFTDQQPDHLPKLVAGVGVAPTEAELMRLA
jgi:hypothetical protein